MSARVLLAGATGYIGARVAAELLGAGYSLLCPVRDSRAEVVTRLTDLGETAAGELRFVEGDLTRPESVAASLGALQADFLVSCLASRSGGIADSEAVDYGANRLLLDWALSHGVRHYTLLSAICVQKPRLAFQYAKRRFEDELAASGLPHSIVRPTAFFKSLSGQLRRVRAGKPFLLFGDGTLTRCKPIAEADLARFLRLTLEDDGLHGLQPIGGPGPAMTPLDQAQLLASLCGRPLRTRSVSPRLLLGIARGLDAAAPLWSPLAERAEFARIGHYYATESMLVWDEARECYDADATPEFGAITLKDSYRAQLEGRETQALGAQAVFD